MNIIENLQKAYPLSKEEVEFFIQSAPRRYKVHHIEKRNGRGLRVIAQPTAELKIIQRWVTKKFINKLPVHDSAMAYRLGKGIKNHANSHAQQKYLLKLDFKDFFPSIKPRDLKLHLANYTDLHKDDISVILKLLFRYDKSKGLSLSIGAPSSPAVSNTIMYPFDEMVSDYCKKRKIKYTRYADDLAFSTNHPHILDVLQNFIRELCESLKYPKLKLNEEKSVFTSKKFQRQLTGLILTNDGKISLGRDKKRLIRAMAHNYKIDKLDPKEVSRLRGWLAFALSVEPEYVESIKRMLDKDIYEKLMK
ncbi:MAG TPA: RNA-directed DNA polymerase [Alcaligenes faecalis]|nr:retron St85 family RNA-directed DNA polymerase [Alcaligenes faecalis]HBQ88072.1 RNA-directed DNA polymerase [Alcaligenes faecalis]